LIPTAMRMIAWLATSLADYDDLFVLFLSYSTQMLQGKYHHMCSKVSTASLRRFWKGLYFHAFFNLGAKRFIPCQDTKMDGKINDVMCANAYGSAFQQFDWFSDRIVLTRRSCMKHMKATVIWVSTDRRCVELITNTYHASAVCSGQGKWFVTSWRGYRFIVLHFGTKG
jgi:hypothetical protein